MKCVVVTGAGASRALGKKQALPLMDDWANSLCSELNACESGLAEAFGLRTEMSGQEFEEHIGMFLRWRDLRPLKQHFKWLGARQAGKLPQAVLQAQSLEEHRLDEIIRSINVTLFRMFSASVIDEAGAIDAYGNLLSRLHSPSDLMFVTTNYDPAAEIALSGLGLRPDTGFDRPPGRAPILNPQGLVRRALDSKGVVPVIHLHGAVGWYEQNGAVFERHQDQPFNPDFGRPVVLYPDPEKDPTRDAVVQALWVEFEEALDGATHVLVIGHSLHDLALVSKLRAASLTSKVAVSVLALPEGVSNPRNYARTLGRETKRLAGLMSKEAKILPARFGPGSEAILSTISEWLDEPV